MQWPEILTIYAMANIGERICKTDVMGLLLLRRMRWATLGTIRAGAVGANCRWTLMKCFAQIVRRAAILVIWIAAIAPAQVPYPKPLSPQQPRRVTMRPQGANRLQKIVPRNKIAGPTVGQRGAGVPHRGKMKRVPE